MGERIVSTVTNIAVCAALLVLTLATTVLGRLDLEPWNLVIALAIAGAKALLIILYFMHIRYGAGLNRLVVAGGLVWLSILLMGAMDDFVTRSWLPLPGK